MSSSDVTSVILLGLGCAANPWGIMVAVLLLNARRGLWIVWAYVVAWIGAISVVMALILAGVGSTSASSDTTSKGASIVELVIGLVLLGFGAWRLLQARRGSSGDTAVAAEKEQPGWLRAIEEISIIGAFLIGIYSATYPLVVAAAGEILRDDLSSTDETLLAVLFVILGSSTVVAVAALGTFAPSRSAPFLGRMRAWLTVHNAAVMTGILLVFGIALTARGLQSL
jgi:hypothetical protein